MSYIEQLKENWYERPLSEKRILSVVAVLVVMSMFYLLVFDPIVTWREKEQKKLSANNRVYSQVVRLVERFEKQQSSETNANDGLAALIDKSLQDNGLAMRGFQPGRNNDARLRLSDVAYEPLVQWLYDLEYQHKISIEELSISQTKAPGLLIANIRVKKY
jgi:general secretion pathway protein M